HCRVTEGLCGLMLGATLRGRILGGVSSREISGYRNGRAMALNGSGLVSAVIPTRNRPELVMKAVLSALRQSYTRMEVIVVIDGEDRATEERLAVIEDGRLRVISLAVNMGGSAARNVGVRAANGEWIAFLDDDDEWMPQKITLQLETARAGGEAFPVVSSSLIVRTQALDFTGPRRQYEAGKPVSEYLFCRSEFADGAYAMQTSTLFMRRDMMLAVPFRAGLKMHQDWDWLLRASHHPGVNFQVLAEPLTIFRVEDGRSSVSRSTGWEFSTQWAREMRPYFTPKAHSFFLATECMSRAVASKAGAAIYMRIAWDFFTQGAPTFRSFLWMASFVCVPRGVRTRTREFLRSFSTARQTRRGILTKPGSAAAALPDTGF
ncbi:MAG TPA: glycosyltransferase family 2 protein, partial [Silvibacterium sp.]|nr:glycosyltransferase family 2 protein [Silvibacterium sp.]